ncbi:sorting nexin-29-like isoform X2 [Mercenaria mercenaria]|uniref:sorting nexin-29-like isoform X2 n=1 Tax=Mercenaria mercenaria TaxID=6596 RepID=UPI00234F5A1D|nr:sorting nexin-29-like isoform X2 [Mercenaria mercenaria]
MNGDDAHAQEKQSLQTRLLDAVKQCQVRFGGRTELATDTDARVSCLCAAWESVLQHGMKGETKAIAALKQVTEMTGLTKVAEMFADKPIEKDLVFWNYVKEVLTRHEADRFMNLKNINSDSGRGRSWLRASLNEHSLERYMHMLVESDTLLSQFYNSWAFLRDQEKNSMLPMMARGLDSILFAITVDNAELNTVLQTPKTVVNVGNLPASTVKPEEELRPVIAGESPPDREKKKEKKKKKKVSHIVSFDEDDSGLGRFSRVNQTGKSGSFSFGSPSDASEKLAQQFQTISQESVTSSSKISANVESAGFKTIDNGASAMTQDSQLSTMSKNSQSGAMTQNNQSGAMLQSNQTDDVFQNGANIQSSHVLRSSSREPSIASGRSDNRRSQGSFSSADFELSMEMSGTIMTPVTPGGRSAIEDDDTGLGRSYDSNTLSAYNGEDIQSATFALQQAQISFNESHRTQGDGGNVSDDIHSDRMSTEELKKAVVSMMLRKDEVEEQNKSLKQMLEQEMDSSSILRAEIEDMKHTETTRQEKEQAKLQALQKENELLKHQLRKYVNAVQMLRTEGTSVDVNLGIHVDEPQPTIPPEKPKTDYSHEAEEYEKKLIQVAEMHGELMEFNELLHRQLNMRENMLKRLQNELVDLRGPLPHDINFTDDLLAMGTESLSMQQTRLINVWIPSAFLRGSASDTYHVYQVYVRIKDEEWNVYKRYKQFNELHGEMKKKHPLTGKFEFPPKKSFGKKDSKVVEGRRVILQTYLRCLINYMLEKDSRLSNNPCKQTLLDVLPFFRFCILY